MPWTESAGPEAVLTCRGPEALSRGDCVAKAQLLAQELEALGIPTRLVRWQYVLPRLVPEQSRLGFETDIHTTVEALVDSEWVLVDATHDPGLAGLGLTVGAWDGRTRTAPAYPASGPVWVVGCPADDRAADEAVIHLLGQIRTTPPEAVQAYRSALNRLFDRARAGHPPHSSADPRQAV